MKIFALSVSVAAMLLLAGALPAAAKDEGSAAAERDPGRRGKKDRSEDFERSYARAMELYEQGKYSMSIEEFERAYQLKNLPRVVYNMARAHFKLGHSRDALELYQRYLELEPSPPAEQKQQAEEDIKLSRSAIETEERLQVSGAKIGVVNDPAGSSSGALTSPAPVRDGPPRPPVYKRWWFWTLLVGAAAVGADPGRSGDL
jgi:tetratricopeptide (TPR) repeat protein